MISSVGAATPSSGIDDRTGRIVAYNTPRAEQAYLELLRHALTGALYDESAWREVTPVLAWRRWLIGLLASGGFKLVRARAYDPRARERGHDHPGIGYTMVGLKRLENIEALLRIVHNERVAGDFLEAGVWRGGASIYAKAVLRVLGDDRRVWLADSFEGLPKPTLAQDAGRDLSSAPHLKVGAARVRAAFERFGLWDDQVKILEGWFSDTLPNAPVESLAVLRLDGDPYQSTMDILNPLYDKVVPGGFLIVDDYLSWEPCRRAIHDFFVSRKIAFEPTRIDDDGVYWRKPR